MSSDDRQPRLTFNKDVRGVALDDITGEGRFVCASDLSLDTLTLFTKNVKPENRCIFSKEAMACNLRFLSS